MRINVRLHYVVVAGCLAFSVGCQSGENKKAYPRLASITTPSPGATLPGSSVGFQWDSGVAVSQYHLTVGTSGPASKELFDQNIGAQRSHTVAGIPTDGRTIYVRLWSLTSKWFYRDYTYASCTTCGGAVLAAMASPAPGSTLAGTTATFQWDAGVGAKEFHLAVGTGGPQSADLFNQNVGSQRSRPVTNIPTDGRTIYVRLWSLTSSWLYRDYTYASCTKCGGPVLAAITSPAPGSTLEGPAVTFAWDPGQGASQYHLAVGTDGPGSTDLFDQNLGKQRSRSVDGVPTDGRTVYVRLWSLTSSWLYREYMFSSAK
jgi:hypothetical protein